MAATEIQSPPQPAALRHAFGNVLSFFILLLIGVLAFSIRLFSVSFSPAFIFSPSDFLRQFRSNRLLCLLTWLSLAFGVSRCNFDRFRFVCLFGWLAQVIKYESVIHEFDPYFNYRVTQVCHFTGFFWINALLPFVFHIQLEYPIARHTLASVRILADQLIHTGLMWFFYWFNMSVILNVQGTVYCRNYNL